MSSSNTDYISCINDKYTKNEKKSKKILTKKRSVL